MSLRVPPLTNSGTLGEVLFDNGTDVFRNYVLVANPEETITMKSGIISDTINQKDGADKFFGGANAEVLVDSNGAGLVDLGGRNDL